MRIDINFQSSAQKLKHKAISNSIRKGKTNSPAWPTTMRTRPTCAQCVRRRGPRTQAGPRREHPHNIPPLQQYGPRPSPRAASCGTGACAGHMGPTPTYLRGRRSPRVWREAMGGGCKNWDTVEVPLHDGGHPVAMAMAFRWDKATTRQ